MDKKNLLTRTVTGAGYGLLMLSSILFNNYFFIAIFSIVLIPALIELYRMSEASLNIKINKTLNVIIALATFLVVSIFASGYGTAYTLFSNSVIGAILLIFVLIYVIYAIFNKGKDVLKVTLISFFSQIYVTMPLCVFALITNMQSLHIDGLNYIFTLPIFIFIWVNDSFAFFTGVLFGKHKLVERISPKKTIEGFVGGATFTILSSFIFAYFFSSYSVPFWIGFAVIVSLFATLGDLFESLIKRHFGVKDAGTILPGHGGVLDRIDSILIVSIASYVYITLMS